MPIKALAQPIISDPEGIAHPNAIYIPSDIHMDPIDQQGSVDWRCYHSPSALLAGQHPLSECSVHIHISPTNNALVSAFTPTTASTTYAAQTWEALWFVAQTVCDTDRGAKDANGLPVLEPFFKTATVTSIG